MVRRGIPFLAALAFLTAGACAHGDEGPREAEIAPTPPEGGKTLPGAAYETDEDREALGDAVAILEGRSGADVRGNASFAEQSDRQTAFRVDIQNAPPGTHAIHIHETGDCSAPDASSAGDHWNPTGRQHGKWGEGEFHLGDIGNIVIGEDGTGSIELRTELWSVGGDGPNDVVGKALVMHAGADDFQPPAGHAGKRIACGVIELARQYDRAE